MIKKLFASCLLTVVVIGMVVVGGFYFLTREGTPEIEEGSYLILDLAGDFPEEAPGDFWTQLLEGEPLTILDIVENIRKARYDDRIEGVLLRISIITMGFGKVQEIRDALTEFRESGKKVISYIEVGRDIEYYLATAADEVFMAPVSALMVDGIVGNALFVRGTFDMLGIKPNFIRIGDYKTAVDMFTSKEMSEAQRLMINSILDSIFSRFVTDVAGARGVSEDKMREIIDRGLFDSRQALEEGLVDDLLYLSQLEGKMKGEEEEFHGVDAEVYRDVEPSSLGISEDVKFALIVAEGTMNIGGSGDSADFGKIAGSSTVNNAIRNALEDEEIEAIILRVNSPGGSWLAADLIWGEITRAMEEKPIVVSMSDVAASGGYYVSMPVDAIVAQPSTITGSIGVYMGKFNIKGFYDMIGVTKETVSRGKNAEIFSELRDFTEEERDKIYKQLWEFYMNDFVRKVHEGRNMAPEFVDSIGRGQVWTGDQALELGLVDELGGIWKAVERAKELAEIPSEQVVSLIVIPEPMDLFERFLEGDLVLNPPTVQISPRIRKMVSSLQWLNMIGSGEIVAMMPYLIEFE
jgi:protease-4